MPGLVIGSSLSFVGEAWIGDTDAGDDPGAEIGMIYANQAAADVQRTAINGLLGYPSDGVDVGGGRHVSTAEGRTLRYTGLKFRASDSKYAIVKDDTIQSLHGQTYGGTTVDTSGATSMTGTWTPVVE